MQRCDKDSFNYDSDNESPSNKTLLNNKEDTMELTLKVEGRMCQNCERHVKQALEAIDGVESALPSHEKNNVVITLSKKLDQSVLIEAITNEGYKAE